MSEIRYRFYNTVTYKVRTLDDVIRAENWTISSDYRGFRGIGTSPHIGIDRAMKVGDPVYAQTSGDARGRVDVGGYGMAVFVTIGDVTITYGHVIPEQRLLIGNNEKVWVNRGELIGVIGSKEQLSVKAKNVTMSGPHLHIDAYTGEKLKGWNTNYFNPRSLTVVDVIYGTGDPSFAKGVPVELAGPWAIDLDRPWALKNQSGFDGFLAGPQRGSLDNGFGDIPFPPERPSDLAGQATDGSPGSDSSSQSAATGFEPLFAPTPVSQWPALQSQPSAPGPTPPPSPSLLDPKPILPFAPDPSVPGSRESGNRSGSGGNGAEIAARDAAGRIISQYTQPFRQPTVYVVQVISVGFRPVILDLNNNGIEITPLSSSDNYFDMDGQGLSQRTAWAGAGDGVLAFDADGDGKITRANEVVFTLWDPTAKTDFEALRTIFDTNRNGLLDAGESAGRARRGPRIRRGGSHREPGPRVGRTRRGSLRRGAGPAPNSAGSFHKAKEKAYVLSYISCGGAVRMYSNAMLSWRYTATEARR